MNDDLYDPTWVEKYFDDFAEKEWDRLIISPAREVQLAIHNNLLNTHIRKGDKVLEVGAGPGRFTQSLANLRAKVTVTDISSVQVALNKENSEKYGFAGSVNEWHQLDMCDMSRFDDNSFDAVVAYGGPLSYVLDKRDIAIQECIRLAKPGGIILLSVMCLWGTIHQYLDGVLGFSPEDNLKIIESGDLTQSNSKMATHYCHLFRSQELRTFLESHNLEVIDMAASNVLTPVHVDRLIEARNDEAKWKQVLDMELKACREPGNLDAGTHIIAAVRKPR